MLMSIRYNFRNPQPWARESGYLYNRILDQIEWADRVGFDRITFAEHHFLDEGFLPALMPMMAAVAARTKRVLLGAEILLLPLHHPVRLAEDAAIVDIISNGRLQELGVAGGYREEEYAGLGMKLAERAGRMEECLQIVRKCWTEDEFSFDGRYYKLTKVRMFPKPIQKGGPRLILGGSAAAVARRAARLADGLFPMTADLWDVYYDELERLGRPAERRPPPPPQIPFLHVSEDPERDWEQIRPHARFELDQYRAWGMDATDSYGDLDEQALRAAHPIWTPEQAKERLLARQAEYPDSVFSFAPVLAGMDPDLAQQSLELIAAHVLPALKAAQGAAGRP